MDYKFGVYGDSIAFGYGNKSKSWFDIFTDEERKLKLAENGEKALGVLAKIKQDNNHYGVLFLAVGVNDLLQDDNVPENCEFDKIISVYREIVQIASKIADRVVIQSVLPVREKEFPNQDWLRAPEWIFNTNIEKFNIRLKNLAEEKRSVFLDAYREFSLLCLDEIMVDAVHLNKDGYKILAGFYKNLVEDFNS